MSAAGGRCREGRWHPRPRSGWLFLLWHLALEAAASSGGGGGPASGNLTLEAHGFRLVGAREASLREINGGRYCVGGMGKQPPAYEADGPFNLDACAKLAKEQPTSLGFRWGRRGFNTEVYREFTNALDDNEIILSEAPRVDLLELFDFAENYTCVIYVSYKGEEPAEFVATELSRSMGYRPTGPSEGPGSEVCAQRWTLAQFFYVPKELWFCYMPTEKSDACNKNTDLYHRQGYAFIAVCAVFLAFFAFILRGIGDCVDVVLVWSVRVLLNLELGLVVVVLLVEFDAYGVPGIKEYVVATLLVAVSFNVIMLPYHVIVYCFRQPGLAGTYYLLLLLFTPCISCELISYRPSFPLLASYRPMVIGLVGFMIECLKVMVFQASHSMSSRKLHTFLVYDRNYASLENGGASPGARR